MQLRNTLLLFLIFGLLAGSKSFGQTEKKLITLDDVFKNRKFSSRGVAAMQSMNDGEHFCQLKKDSLNIYEYKSGKYTGTIVTSGQLMPAGDTVPADIGSFEFSDDESRILFARDEEPLYRRSSKANHYIFDRQTGTIVPLSDKGKQRLATFSPDASKVAFVRDNNLFICELGFGPKDGKGKRVLEAAGKEYEVTFDGKANEIINGATDWVYEEEFEFSKAFCWSPDGSKLAFYRFDESKVKEYQLTYYGELYPEQYKYKYPKAGEANSIIEIKIFDLKSKKMVSVDVGKETDIYIPRLKWTEDPGTLALYRMNRHQSRLELLLVNAANGQSRTIYTEENKYYIEVNDHWTFLKSKKGFIISSEKDGYRHLYYLDMSGKLINQVTKGNWEVTDLYGIDEVSGKVYFASNETSPVDKDINVTGLDGSGMKKLSTEKGTNTATFNKTYTYFVHRWSDINTPPVVVLRGADGSLVRSMQDNAKLRETIATYQYSKAEFIVIKTGEGIELNAAMMKPYNFDPAKKYPVLFTIYGGPGSQTVLNSWGTFSAWNQLWQQNGIIVVSVDNRGTGGRGEEFKKCTYLELGKYETIDQVEAAKYFASLDYVDKNRIGIWGWSFGGYLTLSCLTKGADYFSFGIAVAPVTNWKYYDNIYTERFMRTPQENNAGYEANSPVNHAEKLKGKLLMIHGMADDNVHPQNAYDMFTALVAADKTFDSEFYPNSNHGIYSGKNTTIHLYKRFTDFILKNL